MIRSVSLLIIIIILGCSSIESPEKLWEQVKLFRSEKNLKDAIATCKLILKEHPKNEFASTALFQVGDIYLNDVQDFDFAIQYFQEVVDKYPESKETEKAYPDIKGMLVDEKMFDKVQSLLDNYRKK